MKFFRVTCAVRCRSTGFILEDFPRVADEAGLLAETGFYPDAAIVLEMEETDAVARLLPARLARWRVRRQQVLQRSRQKKERRRQRREAAMDRRRAKLQKGIDKRKTEREVDVFVSFSLIFISCYSPVRFSFLSHTSRLG